MMKKIGLLSVAVSALLHAGGYKIPENSLNSMALSAAYVANAHGADASYFNPANMAFDNKHMLELDMTYIALGSIDFDGQVGDTAMSAGSKSEAFLVPSMHYVAPKYGDVTLGFSIVVPGGLSKRWNEQPARSYAKEFTLQVVELNPTIAYKLSDSVAVGGGLRLVQSSGVVKSQSTASRDMQGDSIDYGYNLAISYRPSSQYSFAATYRSNVDLSEVGTAQLYFPDNADYSGDKVYDGDVEVTVPLPATLALAAAYHFESGTTVEVVYERAFWSAYKELDFDYEGAIGALKPNFDDPIEKKWNDTNTYRLGVTQTYENWTAMAGIGYDETPVPEERLSFELPDSDAWIVSMGGRYSVNEHWDVGLAALLDIKTDRNIDNNTIGIDGEFSDGRAYLITLGAGYTF